MIPKKKMSTDEDWLYALENIESLVSRSDLEAKISETVQRIKAITYGHKVAYCWSGGKDALALEVLCNKAGIFQGVMVHSELEYPSFMKWVYENKKPDVAMYSNGCDLRWLARNRKYLFADLLGAETNYGQNHVRKYQFKYLHDNDLTMLIVGRRLADGNYCGRRENGFINYVKGQNALVYSPMAEWSHEEVLALLHYYEIELPPFYFWEGGFIAGTHPWFEKRRHLQGEKEHWQFLWKHEPSVVERAASFFDLAKEVIQGEWT